MLIKGLERMNNKPKYFVLIPSNSYLELVSCIQLQVTGEDEVDDFNVINQPVQSPATQRFGLKNEKVGNQIN